MPFEIEAVLPFCAASSIASNTLLSRWIVGTKCRSALTEFGVWLTMIIPTPPAIITARLLSMRALTPR